VVSLELTDYHVMRSENWSQPNSKCQDFAWSKHQIVEWDIQDEDCHIISKAAIRQSISTQNIWKTFDVDPQFFLTNKSHSYSNRIGSSGMKREPIGIFPNMMRTMDSDFRFSHFFWNESTQTTFFFLFNHTALKVYTIAQWDN